MLDSIAYLLAVVVLALVARAWQLRRKPPLESWHRVRLREEFRAADRFPGGRCPDFGGWLEIEERVFEELDRGIYGHEPASDSVTFERYRRGSLSDPARVWPNDNRTFELAPEYPQGAVLLLHGLTDSPYSVYSLAPVFRRRGLHAIGLRLPGHGTAPSGLAYATRHDWRAAVSVGIERARERAGDGPIYLLGYSAGGALALHAILDAIGSGDSVARGVLPRRLFLVSPAIGITYLARLANWHKAVSYLPPFEKAGWLTLSPEYDPFKYNSHHKNGGDELHLLCKSLKRRLRRARRRGRTELLPPILTFQSVVDATVVASELFEDLYGRLEGDHHELVLFDTNRWSSLRPFLSGRHGRWLEKLVTSELPYRFTLVTNRTPEVRDVVARTRPARGSFGEDRELGLSWPEQVYSLSHVALPFPPDDPFYGGSEGNPDGDVYHLGTAHPRGERDLLRVPIGQLMRLRHNPFHPYLVERIDAALEADGLRIDPE